MILYFIVADMKYLLDCEETERLYFGKVHISDFDSWLPFFKDPASLKHWIGELQEPEVECENWYRKQLIRYETDQGGMNALIEKKNGNLVGHCGLLVQIVDGTVELEIGYSLLPNYINKGFATEAAIKCRDHAFQNSFSDSLISIVSHTNIPSANVARKNGMTIRKQTVYNQNPVNIFGIHKIDWENQNSARTG